jgi:hypothetical protein
MKVGISKTWLSAGITTGLVILALFASTVLAQESADNSTLSPMGGSPTEAFTYQGYLEEAGQPANGIYDFRFSVYDQETDGTRYGTPQELADITVTDGIFTVYLRPGSPNEIFTGGPRWLQIEVRPGSSGGSYTTLDRQPIASAPYAWSLRPMAVISGSTGTIGGFGNAILNIDNSATPQLSGGGGGGPAALYARASTGSAVRGESFFIGVTGQSTDTVGVLGLCTTGDGVEGSSTSGRGVYGYSTDNHGVHGYSVNNVGVIGVQSGYYESDLEKLPRPGGLFGGQYGVVGITKEDLGSGVGVLGWDKSTTGGWAGRFSSDNGNGVHISAAAGHVGLTVAGGTKNAVVPTDAGSRLLYTEESTEVWFSDYGFGQLVGGAAEVVIADLFAQTVNLEEPYHVFVQVYGDAEVYISNRTPTRFKVHLRDGDPDVEFSYRIVARRLGYEDARMEPAPWADDDPNLYSQKEDSLDTRDGRRLPGGTK